jgi:hypothetical protein
MTRQIPNIYPNATKMLNIGKFGYMKRITAALGQIAKAEEFLLDEDFPLVAETEDLIVHLKNVIEQEESDARERFEDLNSDIDFWGDRNV